MRAARAIVLAAGRGERMRPLTDSIPKPLLEVGGRALIEWQIERLARAGVRELVINVSHLAPLVQAALGDGSRLGVSIAWSHEPVALETAGGIAQALPLIGPGPFIAVNADLWSDYDCARLLPVLAAMSGERPACDAHLVLVGNPEHHPQGDFTLDASGAVSNRDTGRLTFSGIGVYRPGLFSGIASGSRAALGPLLRAAADAGRVRGERHAGRWIDVGTPGRLEALRREWGR